MIKKAMILAAGFGKRINPLTLKQPKPLLKIGNETLLSNTLKFLEQLGIKQAVINVHYLGEQIVDYINRNQFNLTINIVKEKNKILNTGGGVLNAIQYFSNEPFLIINPDTIWNSHYLKALKSMEKSFFENKKNKCSLLVVNNRNGIETESARYSHHWPVDILNVSTKYPDDLEEFIAINPNLFDLLWSSKDIKVYLMYPEN